MALTVVCNCDTGLRLGAGAQNCAVKRWHSLGHGEAPYKVVFGTKNGRDK